MQLASVFTDGAVLQRRVTLPVWGTAEPFALVHAELNGQISWTRAADDGKFMLRLPAMEAGGPFELTVETQQGEKIVLHDILIGEVWLAGGQSNMEYLLSTDVANCEIPAAERPNLLSRQQEREFYQTNRKTSRFRFITIPHIAPGMKMSTFHAQWHDTTPEFAKACTAVGAWFGKHLSEELDVPIGIISDNWGGTFAESWTGRNGLLRNPRTAPMLEILDRKKMERGFWPDSRILGTNGGLFPFDKYTVMDSGNEGLAKGWAAPEFEDSAWKNMTVPGDWIEQKISGNGAVWFRKTVELPESWNGKDLVLELGGIDKHDITWFNGVEIGRTGKDFETQYWDTLRTYPVPAALVRPGKNVIAVRAYSFCFNGGFNGESKHFRLSVPGTAEEIGLAGNWLAWPEKDLGVINPVLSKYEKILPGDPNNVGVLFESMLCPVAPYAIRGAIWYQGEANGDEKETALDYCNTMKNMVEDWRDLWGQGDFPFLQVQLAGFREPQEFSLHDLWPLVRESQFKLTQTLKNVGIISAVDIGMANDIHPWDKKSVGMRLAAKALHDVYHRTDVVPNGPEYISAQVEGSTVRISFKEASGLCFKGGAAKGFYIAGADRVFRKADSVRVEGSSVVVSCSEIALPAAVRYSWADNPDGNLYNAAGQPAFPFRTDEWML